MIVYPRIDKIGSGGVGSRESEVMAEFRAHHDVIRARSFEEGCRHRQNAKIGFGGVGSRESELMVEYGIMM